VDVLLLIDQIVRQKTVLIAQLATASGVRAPLSHVAGHVFFDLTRELRAGFGQHSHRRHVWPGPSHLPRARASFGGKLDGSWHDVVGGGAQYVQTRTTTRADVLRRFASDDPPSVRAVLSDLVKNGLLYRSGRGDNDQLSGFRRYPGAPSGVPKRGREALQLQFLGVHRLDGTVTPLCFDISSMAGTVHAHN
jgi:hypothetical protein